MTSCTRRHDEAGCAYTRGFLWVRGDMFLVSLDGGPSFREQVLHLWLQDSYLRAIVLQFCFG